MTITSEETVGPYHARPYQVGRPIIFTPERIEQIHTLRERGKTVEEIAEIIGCTVGTLRVRCSQLGISLRYARPTIMEKKTSSKPQSKLPAPNGGNHVAIRTEVATVVAPIVPSSIPEAFLSLQVSLGGKTRSIPFNFSSEQLISLIIAAEIHNMRLTDFIATLLIRIVEHNLVDELTKDLPSK